MAGRHRRGVVVVSVDLANGKTGADAAASLLRLLDEHSTPATWGMAELTGNRFALELTVTRRQHEVALLGDATWVGANIERRRFVSELARRVNGAGEQGISVRSLLLAGAALRSDYDVAVKHGLRGVRSDRPQHDVRGLRYGLWDIPAEVRLPDDARSILTGRSRRVLKVIDRAAATGGVCHIAIDAPRWHSSTGGERVLRQILMHIHRLRTSGLIATPTLGALADALTRPQVVTLPARSILRVA